MSHYAVSCTVDKGSPKLSEITLRTLDHARRLTRLNRWIVPFCTSHSYGQLFASIPTLMPLELCCPPSAELSPLVIKSRSRKTNTTPKTRTKARDSRCSGDSFLPRQTTAAAAMRHSTAAQAGRQATTFTPTRTRTPTQVSNKGGWGGVQEPSLRIQSQVFIHSVMSPGISMTRVV